jgi:uncharacterized protein
MKSSRPFDPLRLDMLRFAEQGAELSGEWPLSELGRLQETCFHDAPTDPVAPVRWQAEGEAVARPGGEPQVWLHLQAEAQVWLQCQRCLQPVLQPLQVERAFRFVRDEQQAEAEDPDSEEDLLALQPAFDLRRLVEDELLLALPLVPRHEVCPQPLPMSAGEEDASEAAEERPNPFAALAALKRGRGS